MEESTQTKSNYAATKDNVDIKSHTALQSEKELTIDRRVVGQDIPGHLTAASKGPITYNIYGQQWKCNHCYKTTINDKIGLIQHEIKMYKTENAIKQCKVEHLNAREPEYHNTRI